MVIRNINLKGKLIGLFLELGWTGGCSNLHICVSCQVWLLTYLHQIPSFVTLYMRSIPFTITNWNWFLDRYLGVLFCLCNSADRTLSLITFNQCSCRAEDLHGFLSGWYNTLISKFVWGCVCRWYSMLWSQIQLIMSSCLLQSRLGHVQYTLFKL